MTPSFPSRKFLRSTQKKQSSAFLSIPCAALFLLVSAINLPSVAEAQSLYDDSKAFIGGQAGIGISNNTIGTQFTFGGTVGYRLFPDLLTSFFINYMSTGSVNSPTATINGSSQSITYYGLEANYPLYRFLDGLHVGAKFGLTSSSVTATLPGVFTGDVSNTQVFIGPKIGFDYPISDLRLSIGAETNLLIKTTSTEPVVGFSTINGVSTIFNILGVVKYWF